MSTHTSSEAGPDAAARAMPPKQRERAELSERSARLALACAADGGDPAVATAVSTHGGPATWERLVAGGFGEASAARAAGVDLAAVVAATRSCGARFVVPGDDEWPERVGDLRFCEPVQRRGGEPVGLWVRGAGRLADWVTRSVSVVGARACTSYGAEQAGELAAELAEQGVAIVSGGAYGIDGAAHRGALAVAGRTVCVLANGVDIGYPRGHAPLFDRLAEQGLLVSELPPGTPPSRIRFLARNRLIAALSLGTVVVEAAVRSGARNTAGWALGCQRHVMAVPGPVTSAMSAAPHLLIRNGQAALVTSAADVLELVSPAGSHTQALPQGSARATDRLDPEQLAVFEAVPARCPRPVDEIALVAGVRLPTCLAHLARLEELGLVEGSEDGWRATLPGRAR